MTPEQRALARHALGLPNRRRRSYRNRYITYAGSDKHHLWLLMVASGLAWHEAPALFGLTYEGAQRALARGETLDPEDFAEAGVARP